MVTRCIYSNSLVVLWVLAGCATLESTNDYLKTPELHDGVDPALCDEALDALFDAYPELRTFKNIDLLKARLQQRSVDLRIELEEEVGKLDTSTTGGLILGVLQQISNGNMQDLGHIWSQKKRPNNVVKYRRRIDENGVTGIPILLLAAAQWKQHQVLKPKSNRPQVGGMNPPVPWLHLPDGGEIPESDEEFDAWLGRLLDAQYVGTANHYDFLAWNAPCQVMPSREPVKCG